MHRQRIGRSNACCVCRTRDSLVAVVLDGQDSKNLERELDAQPVCIRAFTTGPWLDARRSSCPAGGLYDQPPRPPRHPIQRAGATRPSPRISRIRWKGMRTQSGRWLIS